MTSGGTAAARRKHAPQDGDAHPARGYLSLDSFKSPDKSAEGIERVMRDVIKRNPGALVIDLVGNRGGSTNAAQLLMAFLLPKAHRLHERAYVRNVAKTRPPNFEYFDEEAEKLQRYNARIFSKRKPKGGIRSAPAHYTTVMAERPGIS